MRAAYQEPRERERRTDSLSRIEQALKLVTEVISVAALSVLTVFILAVAVGRIMFVPLNALNALALTSSVWLAMVGAAYVQCTDGHVTAGLAVERFLKGPARALVVGVRGVLVAGFIGLLCATGVMQAHAAFADDVRTLDVLRWPMWPTLLAVPVGTALWLSIYLVNMMKRRSR